MRMIVHGLQTGNGEDIDIDISNERILLKDLIANNKVCSDKKAFEYSKTISDSLVSLHYNNTGLSDIIQPDIYQKSKLYFQYCELLIAIFKKYDIKEVIIKNNIEPLIFISLNKICEEFRITLITGPNRLPNNLLSSLY